MKPGDHSNENSNDSTAESTLSPRNDIVYYVEEEFYRIHPEINRTM